MAKSNLNKAHFSGNTVYNRYYTGMRGVDMTGDGSLIDRCRFAYLENMYRDYDGDGAGMTESVPGFRRILSLGEPIRGIHRQKSGGDEFLVIHAGTHLYRLRVDDRDTPGIPVSIATVADRESRSFLCGSSLYLLDGTNFLQIAEDGTVTSVTSDSDAVYVPTTFQNGEELEQRNLLSPRFVELFDLPVPENHRFASRGLRFTVLDADELTCALTGKGTCSDTEIWVPSEAVINGQTFRVVAVGERAFDSDGLLTGIFLPVSVRDIGSRAFNSCNALRKVVTSSDIATVGDRAFADCQNLNGVHFGKGLRSVAANAFQNCSAFRDASYEGVLAEWMDVENYGSLSSVTFRFSVTNTELRVRIPVYDPASDIDSVTADGTALDFDTVTEDGLVTAVTVYAENAADLRGKRVSLSGVLSDSRYVFNSKGNNFLSENRDFTDGADAAILGCRVCEVFDGRVFLAGNPKLPNTVFYTARDRTGRSNPTYFGILNYFHDGVGNFPVCALLSVGDSLAVFKSGDDGNGGIYYHVPESTGDLILPKIYPVSYIHSGIRCLGAALSFYDDPVFVTENGICALDKKTVYLEKSVVCRSHNVNTRLLCERLSDVRMAKWCGYLAVCVGGNIYLADSRQVFSHPTGAKEYEWYFLTGIGTYADDRTVYRYAASAPAGQAVRAETDAPAVGVIGSETGEDGTRYYSLEGGVRYAVYPTEEKTGGTFSPACALLSTESLLFFGTASGDVCVFNNDRRGVAPQRLSSAADFDPAAYERTNGRRIHPDFYSFAGHAPRYALKTCMDNCGIPHLTKDTVHRSLVIKCRSFVRSALTVEVGTDRSGYREITSFPGSEFNFADFDFSSLTVDSGDYFSLPISEKERDWVEKQIAVSAENFCAPIGICSLSYRFTVRGKLRKP